MQDLNTIPSVGTFGEVARNANTNFSLLKIAIDLLEHSIEHSRGYFTSASALTTAFPSPVVGDWAIVEVGGTPTIYKCSTRGTWSNSGTQWAGGSVDLTEYAQKAELYNSGYYICETAAATAAKAVSASGYLLKTGGNIRIKMSYANTAANATLNIGGTGAKPLYYNDARASASNSWEAEETIVVYYDGTNYIASNAKGGGKAEKIKFNNSQSGLAADNVQGALDDLAARERYSQEEMGYSSVVTISAKWINGGVWQSASKAVVILIPKRLFENADRIKVVGVTNTRMMFLKSSNSSIGSNASYCNGTGVMSIGANTRFYDIPSDCNYIYFDYSYGGVSRMPTSIQTIQSISGKIADIDLQVQQNEEDLHMEPVDVSVMVAKTVSGFIIDGGVWRSISSSVIGFIPVVLFGAGSRIDVTGVANTQIAFLTSDSITAGSTPAFCSGTNITTIGAQTMSFDIPSDCVYIYVVVSYSNVSRLPTKIIAHMKVKGLLGKYTDSKTYKKQELLDSYIYDEGKLYNAVSSIGLTIDDVEKTAGTTPCYIFAIPVKGMAEVSYPVFKTTSGFGSLVTDKDGVVIAQYCNTNLTSGTTAHVFLPDNAARMYISVSNSIQGLEYSVTVKGLAATSEINSNGCVLSAKVCYLPFKSTLATNSQTSLNLAAIKFAYEDGKIPFQSGYLFHNYNPDDKKIYFGTKLDNAVEVGELDYYPANRVLGVSPKDGTVIGVYRDNRRPIGVYQNGVNYTVDAKTSDGSNTSPKGWLYNSGCEFVTDGDNEYCIFAEYDGSVSNNQRLYIWKGTYPYTSPSDWKTVYYKTTSYNPVTPGSITHWHMVRRDPWSGIIYCTSGDFSGQFFWIYSTDNGETWNELASDSNDNTKPSWVLDGQPLRCINFIFTEDYIYFATDHGSNNTLNRIRRNSNGLIDLSTREVLAELPYGIAVNSLCFIESPNGLFLFTRIDTGFESEYSKDVPILFWSFKDNKLITLISLKKTGNDWGGHRGKCYSNYTNGQETRPAMGFALNTPNVFDLVGAWNGIGTIYYEL